MTTRRKPWHLRGKEPDIYQMREQQHMSWEQIAAVFLASKTGVIDAYNRHAKKLQEDTHGDKETA
jgi:hypothetical protein